tara:strand:- start:2117 stop:2401 length:285 start_codon:yes stop_codon:yes gene_type:complete
MKYYKMTTTFDEYNKTLDACNATESLPSVPFNNTYEYIDYFWVGSVYTPSDKVEKAKEKYVERDYDIIERYTHSKGRVIKYKEYSDRVEYHTSK